jgi:hypothetical protein
MSWKVINREQARRSDTHYLFVHTDGRCAIADHSLRDITNPAMTDDGLLLLDPARTAEISIWKSGAIVMIPVKNERSDELFVIGDPNSALDWAIAGGVKVSFKPETEELVRRMARYLPATSIA